MDFKTVAHTTNKQTIRQAYNVYIIHAFYLCIIIHNG